MKKTAIKIASVSLAVLLGIGGASVGLYASNNTDAPTTDAVDSSLEEIVTVASVSKQTQSNPNETVYVITNADGSVEKVFDNEYVKDSEVPVKINITYMLDGKVVTPEGLAGKSGKVTMRFDYENLSYENVKIDDKTEKIYVPFTMVSGVLLDDKHFSNIEIKNGKLVDDGNRTIALGIAFPGLADNLSLADYEYNVNVPDYVEITADATDFSLDMSLSIATNEVFSELEGKDIENKDDLKDALDKLNDAANQILDGSAKLYDGLDTLYNKVGELASGVGTLNDGAKKLKDGAGELANGASQVSSGAAELSNGLSTLAANNDTLNGAATQVFNTLLATASNQLKASGFNYDLTIENYAQVIDGIIASLDSNAVYEQAHSQVAAGVEANNDAIVAAVTSVVRGQVTETVTATVREEVEAKVRAKVLADNNLSEETFAELPAEQQEAINAGINQAVDAQMQTAEVQATIESNVNAQMETEQVKGIIATNVEAQKNTLIDQNMQSPEVQGALSQAANGVTTLTNLKASLNSYNQFYVGLQTYTAGVAKASAGAGKLASGAATLSNGASTLYKGTCDLYDGTSTLNSKMPELTDGVSKLRDGAKALNDGLVQFNDEGISKINDFVDNDIETLINRFHATVDASKNYKNTHGSDANSSIKFIYRSEAID